jgi:hypothetical protein
MKRLIFDIAVFVSVFTLPWWLTFILVVVGIFMFAHFYEFIVAGSIVYALHATIGSATFLSSPVWFAVVITGMYIAIQILRQYIIVYQSQ